MTVGLSLYLDLLRFLAAIVVMWSHLAGKRFSGGLFWQITPHGHDAVLIFFVLSGLVIAYVADNKEKSARDYALSRLSRMYSVVIPSLVVTYLLDVAGKCINPSLYIIADTGWTGFAQALVFVNQVWSVDTYPGSNVPFWSLGFEVWYYVFYGVVLFTAGLSRGLVLILLAALTGPKIVALLPLWLAGVATYRICVRYTLAPPVGAALAFIGLLGLVILEAGFDVSRHLGLPSIQFTEQTGDLCQDYAIAALLLIHLVGAKAIFANHMPPRAILGVVRFFANRTFSIYLFHVPIASFLITIIPWPPGSMAGRCAIAGGTFGACLLLAAFTEQKKQPWRRLFARCLRC